MTCQVQSGIDYRLVNIRAVVRNDEKLKTHIQTLRAAPAFSDPK
jgi:hypothetical protein